MADLATLQTRLSETEAAIHALALGERVYEVMRGGRRIRFTETDLPDLRAYRDELLSQIAAAEADAAGTPRRRAIGTVL